MEESKPRATPMQRESRLRAAARAPGAGRARKPYIFTGSNCELADGASDSRLRAARNDCCDERFGVVLRRVTRARCGWPRARKPHASG